MGGLRTLIGHPLWLQIGLDATGIALCVAAVAQVLDPDILLHMVWVVLAVEAFAFGLRVTSVRIAFATVVVFAYSIAAAHAASPVVAILSDLDLEEWPLMVIIAVVVAIMADKVSTTSRRYAALYRQASSRLLTAQEDERQRLARDVHDGIGQTITAIALTLDAGESMLWATDEPPSPHTRAAIRRAQELTALALTEARDVALRLRPARIEQTGLVAAISELAARAGRPIEVRAASLLVKPGLLPIETEVEAYRIVQEALDNSVRHAGAAERWIEVDAQHERLRIEVVDNGSGFEPNSRTGTGLGLAGMAERATAIDGRLRIESRRGAGTRITVDIPMAPAAREGVESGELSSATSSAANS